MAVTIVPSTSTPLQGGTLTYSVVIRNLGPNSVTGASFSNTLQAGLGTITNVVTQVSAGASTPTFATTPTSLSGLVSMPAGGQITVTYQASVSATATGTLTSTASVTEPADRNDPNSVNNTATQTVSVGLADCQHVGHLAHDGHCRLGGDGNGHVQQCQCGHRRPARRWRPRRSPARSRCPTAT